MSGPPPSGIPGPGPGAGAGAGVGGPPTGPLPDFRETPDYRGNTVLIANAVLVGFTVVVFGARIYARSFMTKNLGADDLIAFLAFALLVTMSSMEIHAVNFGSGAHIRLIPKPLLATFFKTLTIQTLLYFWALAFVRFSVLAFLPRLGLDRKTKPVAITVAVLVFAQTVACFAYRLTECVPVGDNFKPATAPGLKCVGPVAHNHMMVGHAISGIVIDTTLLLLPLYIIYTKMIWSKRTIQVLVVMGVGVFVLITGILRLYYMLTLNFASDITFQMATLGAWTDVEGHVGLWCGCFPAMQPIVRIVSYKLGLRSQMLSTSAASNARRYGNSGTGRKSAPGTGNMGSGNHWRMSTKNGYVRNGSGVDDDLDDSDSQRAINKEIRSMELGEMSPPLPLPAKGVRKTTVVVQEFSHDGTESMRRGKSWVDLGR